MYCVYIAIMKKKLNENQCFFYYNNIVIYKKVKFIITNNLSKAANIKKILPTLFNT